jgi:primosomal protein N' (replication factor Y)
MVLHKPTLMAKKSISTDAIVPLGVGAMPVLNEAQTLAAQQLQHAVQARAFHVSVLDGVTGSGKTEVYFQAIAAALAQHQQVLVLVPEIALTAAVVERFARAFGVEPRVWHSDVTQSAKKQTWTQCLSGHPLVVVGARSALFLPFQNLGLIVIDEEHDATYKQEEGVMYHARDMAIVRAKLETCPVVLASATPSCETWYNLQQHRYDVVRLPSRFGGAQLPQLTTVDMRTHGRRGHWLSAPLQKAITETLGHKQQVLLYLNRRGYAPITVCSGCGYRVECPQCAVGMVDHSRYLLCHHCGKRQQKQKTCPECGEEEGLIPCGPGVERLSDEVTAQFPEARVTVLSSDSVTTPKAMAALLERIHQRETDIIIGTQIIAKGHHFPDLTLVGVVDADLGMSGADPRAAERTFQLLQQVAGRAGRGVLAGRVLLQTYTPEHPLMQHLASQDRDAFMAYELETRARFLMPPYGRLAVVTLSGKTALTVETAARGLAQTVPGNSEIEVWGPTPAPILKLRNQYRWQFILKTQKGNFALQKFIHEWVNNTKLSRAVNVAIDIDPYRFI